MYKAPCNLIFFPIPIFKNRNFLPRYFLPLPLFPTWYSSKQLKYYREDHIASPFPYFHIIFFPPAMKFLFLYTTWYSSPTHFINMNFICDCYLQWLLVPERIAAAWSLYRSCIEPAGQKRSRFPVNYPIINLGVKFIMQGLVELENENKCCGSKQFRIGFGFLLKRIRIRSKI